MYIYILLHIINNFPSYYVSLLLCYEDYINIIQYVVVLYKNKNYVNITVFIAFYFW